jgi:cellulose 1,4-beta-cellobiosidase
MQTNECGGAAKCSSAKPSGQRSLAYCDAQCPNDIKPINGEGNSAGWKPQSNNEDAGKGRDGSRCPEMDIWQANSQESL